MERYMTDKAKKGPWWEYPVMILSGILVIGFLQASVDNFKPEHPVASIASSLTVILLSGLPLIWVLVRRDRRGTARILSECLANRREDFIPFDRLDKVTGMKHAAAKLDTLIQSGYLRGLIMDLNGRRVRVNDAESA